MNFFDKSRVPQEVLDVLGTLETAGFEAWLVGGCVRDMLMGLTPHDYDIASEAPPAQVRALFVHTVPTGERYGTVTVLTGRYSIEVTVFRSESGYSDFRRPDTVTFSGSIRQDLARRDFTLNAMAWHPARGLFDPFEGRADLKNRLLRAVGRPQERFTEDPLRILRGFRFMAQHGLSLEPETLLAARQCAPLVAKISGERIREELCKLLLAHPSVMAELVRAGTLDFLSVSPQKIDYISVLDDFGEETCPPVLGWSAFLFLTQVNAQTFFDCLHFDNRTRMRVSAVLGQLELSLPDTKAELKRRLSVFKGEERLYEDALRLYGALFNQSVAPYREMLGEVLQNHEPYSLPMLAITGNDLIRAGIVPPGPQLGAVLRLLLGHVIEQPEDNRRELLLRLVASGIISTK